VSDDRFPAETEPPISEDLRQRGIDVPQELLAGGKVDLDRFRRPLMGLWGPAPMVAFTPAARRRQEPLKISTSISDVRLKGRWQVGRLTKISPVLNPVAERVCR
jgi:hypothetical protein